MLQSNKCSSHGLYFVVYISVYVVKAALEIGQQNVRLSKMYNCTLLIAAFCLCKCSCKQKSSTCVKHRETWSEKLSNEVNVLLRDIKQRTQRYITEFSSKPPKLLMYYSAENWKKLYCRKEELLPILNTSIAKSLVRLYSIDCYLWNKVLCQTRQNSKGKKRKCFGQIKFCVSFVVNQGLIPYVQFIQRSLITLEHVLIAELKLNWCLFENKCV